MNHLASLANGPQQCFSFGNFLCHAVSAGTAKINGGDHRILNMNEEITLKKIFLVYDTWNGANFKWIGNRIECDDCQALRHQQSRVGDCGSAYAFVKVERHFHEPINSLQQRVW